MIRKRSTKKLPRSSYWKHRSSCSRPFGVQKKIFSRKSSYFKWLLSFQYNRSCSENISMKSLFHGDWCSEIGWKKNALAKLDGYKFSQSAITCSTLTIKTLEQGVKCVQSNNEDTRTTPMAANVGWVNVRKIYSTTERMDNCECYVERIIEHLKERIAGISLFSK